MINVRATYLNGGFLLECKGHAGYAEKGKDIVCAGVSGLLMGLIERFTEMEEENMITIDCLYVSPGELMAQISYPMQGIVKLLTEECIKTVLAGLNAIAERYEDYVNID